MQIPKISSRFWRIITYLSLGFAALFLVFILTIWIVFEKKNDWLLSEIQNYLNESQSGKLEVQSMELSLIRSFPGVTIVLNGIEFYQHHDSLRTVDEKPILKAEQFYIHLRLIPLLREEVKISDVILSNAMLHLETDEAGKLNLMKALAPPTKPKPVVRKVAPNATPKTSPPAKSKQPKPVTPTTQKTPIQIDLQHIGIQNVELNFSEYGASDSSIIQINTLEVDFLREKNTLKATIASDQNLQQVHVNGITINPGHVSLTTDLQFDRSSRQFNINSDLNLEGLKASITGTYTHDAKQYLDLQLDASASDLELLSLVLSPEIVKRNAEELKRGDVYLKGTITGETKNQLPSIKISIGARDLSWQSVNKNVTFEKIGFEGRFESGTSSDLSQAHLEIKNLKGKLPGGSLHGFFSITNFTDPVVAYDLKVNANLEGYDEIFNLKSVKNLKGAVSLNAKFDGPLKEITTHQMDSSRSSNFLFKDISFLLAQTNQQVSGFNAEIKTQYNQTTIQPFFFQYGQNKVQLTANAQNLLYFLLKKRDLVVSGKITAPQLYTKDFLFDSLSSAQVQERISDFSCDFQISTPLDSVSSKPKLTFKLQNLTAKLDQLPDLKKVDVQGEWKRTSEGLKLELQSFHAILPQGAINVVGDLLVLKKTLWKFNADIKLNKFPWNYVNELASEIQDNKEPSAKNLPISEMDLLTANLKTSSTIITYPFDITSLQLQGNKIMYQLPGSKPLLADELNLSLEQLLFKHPENAGNLTGLRSAKGNMKVKKLNVPGLKMDELQSVISGSNDLLNLDLTAITPKSKQERGQLTINFEGKDPGFHLIYDVREADAKYFISEFTKQKIVTGLINYKMDLSTSGLTWANIKQNASGKIEVSGSSLRFYGLDIDKALRKYERSQNFSLVDVGAVVIAGPVGLAVTKGSEFVSLAAISTDSTKQTLIKNLYSRWDLDHLKLTTEDVAFTTTQNRIAFNGQIDFSTNTVPGLTIAVVDKKGCSLMDQKLSGNFGSLKTGKLNITKTLLGSVINFVNAIVGNDCKPIYNGSVPAPEK